MTLKRRKASSDRHDWLTAPQATAAYPVSASSLRNWAQRCPALGREIRSKPNPAPPFDRLYWRADIERAVSGKRIPRAAVAGFRDEAGHWLSVQKAVIEYRISAPTLNVWRRKGCPVLGGRKLEVRERRFKGRRRHFVRREDLDAIVEARKKGPNDASWVTASRAAAEYGFIRRVLYRFTRASHRLLGRPIRSKRIPVPTAIGKAKRRVFWRADLEKLGRMRRVPSAEWLTISELEARFGFPRQSLKLWRMHGCPHLGGRKPTARVRWIASDSGEPIRVWEYRGSDLEQIAERWKPRSK